MEKSQEPESSTKPAVTRVLRTPKVDKYGMARCGFCHTCQNPQLKKACITNKNKRLSEGWEPPPPASKVKVPRSGEKRLKIAGISGVGTIIIRQPGGDLALTTPKPKAEVEDKEKDENATKGNVDGGLVGGGDAEGKNKNKRSGKKKRWHRRWVLVPNLLQNGYCRLLKWVDDDTYDEKAALEELRQKSAKIEFIPDSSLIKAMPRSPMNNSTLTMTTGGIGAVNSGSAGHHLATSSAPNTPSANVGTSSGSEKQQNGHRNVKEEEHDAMNEVDKVSGAKGGKVEVTTEAWNPASVVSPKQKKSSLRNASLKALYPGALMCTHEGCEKFFADSSALRKHMRTHAEKGFVCTFPGCSKRFQDSSKLKRHFLIHTGKKRFVCPFKGCGKACSLDFNLRSHIRSMHKEEIRANPEILKMKLLPVSMSSSTSEINKGTKRDASGATASGPAS